MSTTTPYLGLTLYDATTDQAVTFATFRAVWGGTATTSNFYKIDTGMSGFNTRITNLENASSAVPVLALFSSSNFYTATGVTGISAYNTGSLIILSLDTTSDGTVTLDINSLGTKSVMKVDSTGTPINLTGSDLVEGRQYLFIYDGTRWLWVSANSADQIQIVGTDGNVVTVGSTNNLLGTLTQSLLISQTINGATGKTTLVDADKIGIVDSEDSNVLKSVTFEDFKSSLPSGTYTPTLTNTTNIDSSTAFACQFMRVGNVVNVSGAVAIDATASGAVVLSLSPPFASNFSSNLECRGLAASSGGEFAQIRSNSTSDLVEISYTTTITANQTFSFVFTYVII